MRRRFEPGEMKPEDYYVLLLKVEEGKNKFKKRKIMAKEVIKKDGSRHPFDAEKIKNSIRAAASQADLSEERINEVVDRVTAAAVSMADAKEEIASSEIKEKILSELDNVEPSISESWRKYDAEKKGA